MIATLERVLSQRAGVPVTARRHSELIARELKAERLHAEKTLMEEGGNAQSANLLRQERYSEGVKDTIAWLLGSCNTLLGDSVEHPSEGNR